MGEKKETPDLKSIFPENAEKIAYEHANKFISNLEKDEIDYESVNVLAQLGFHQNNEVSKRTLEPLFGVVINDLKKSFEKREGEAYLKIMPHFILKAKERSKIIENWFNELNISKENPVHDIYERSKKLREKKNTLSKEEIENIKKIILLSRNTIGSEAYINGIIIERLIEKFKNAEIVFTDTSNTGKHIFNNSKIRLVNSFINKEGKEVSLLWDRLGIQILDRFEYTANLAEFIKEETKFLKNSEFFVVDADTRLSQTGAMPICDVKNHIFIDTVLDNNEAESGKIDNFGIVCNNYLNRLFNENKISYPKIYIKDEEKEKARKFMDSLPKEKPIIMLHFGSGLNYKALSKEFEKQLALKLFEYGTPLIILTPVEWETQKIKETISFIEQQGKKQGRDFFTFNGPLSTFVALIGQVDLCIGYDSQCQHMAAALGIPFITLFTGHINKAFLKRWTPLSKNFSKIIEVDKKQGDYNDLIFREKIEKKALEDTIETLSQLHIIRNK